MRMRLSCYGMDDLSMRLASYLHLLVIRLHQLIPRNALHKPLLRSSAAPGLQLHLLRHASSEAR